MTATAPPRRATPQQTPTPPASNGPRIGKVEPKLDPPRIVFNAVEGYGKSTLGAFSPNPMYLMARGETGYRPLLAKGLVPQVDTVLDASGEPKEIGSWNELLNIVDHLIANPTGHQTLVFDALGGFERLCHEHVCLTKFSGDWGEKGFSSYQRGYDVSVPDWLTLLQRLDRLRMTRGMAVLFLSHCKVKTFKNPDGADYDRWICDAHEKTWGVTHKWADAVLFGDFFMLPTTEKGRTKAKGGQERIVYTQHTATRDAKNRYALPPQLRLPNDPAGMWTVLADALGAPAAAVDASSDNDTDNSDAPPEL